MKIEEAIAHLEHFKNEGHKYVERRGMHWVLSSTEHKDLFDDVYYQSLINPDANIENIDKWVEGEDYVWIECKISILDLMKDLDRGFLRCVVDLEPINQSDLPEWYDPDDFDIFQDIDLHELRRSKGDIEDYI